MTTSRMSAGPRTAGCTALLLAAGLAFAPPSQAAEYGLGSYLLGLTVPMAGFTPPPGLYFSDTLYYYQGSTNPNVNLPFGRNLALGLNERFLVNITSLSWFAPTPIFGGTLGFAGTVPVARVKVSADAVLSGPLGGASAGRSDSATGLGDTALSAILGWHAGDHHWNITVTGILPTGLYNPDQLAFVGLNRPGVDVKGGYTFLNMQTGIELSGALGVTFNATNTQTDYTTGTELHFEAAAIQHFSPTFSLGVGGYIYQQLTGDSGSGARLGPFKGRTVAVGPVLGYTFKAGEIPVTLNGRWFHEVDVENRIKGNSVFATLTMPLSLAAPPSARVTK